MLIEMSSDIETLKKLLMPVLENADVYLVDMELRGRPNSQVLSIYIDTEDGITLQQIADITREFEGILDLEDPIQGKYRLDISSPGIDRPLTEVWQFKKNVGRNLRVTYSTEDKINESVGTLTRIDDQNIWLEEKNKEVQIPLREIKKAIIKLNW